MAGNPVAYAENELGVHHAYDQALDALGEYEHARMDHVARTVELRAMRDNLADLEAVIASEERGANPDMSAAAFDRHLKAVVREHAEHQRVRAELALVQGESDRAEASVKIAERRVDVFVARLNELAGLLNFYAARSPRP